MLDFAESTNVTERYGQTQHKLLRDREGHSLFKSMVGLTGTKHQKSRCHLFLITAENRGNFHNHPLVSGAGVAAILLGNAGFDRKNFFWPPYLCIFWDCPAGDLCMNRDYHPHLGYAADQDRFLQESLP